MLDLERLARIPLLQKAGWTPARAGGLAERYRQLNFRYPPQVPPERLFSAAWEVVDALDGVCIPNQCPELGMGSGCSAIEFDFFHYDDSVRPELLELSVRAGEQVVFLGIGYDIAGDWLMGETGRIWFRNGLKRGRGPVLFSRNIYDFLEKELHQYRDLSGENIF